jgi:hypothetical protein
MLWLPIVDELPAWLPIVDELLVLYKRYIDNFANLVSFLHTLYRLCQATHNMQLNGLSAQVLWIFPTPSRRWRFLSPSLTRCFAKLVLTWSGEDLDVVTEP